MTQNKGSQVGKILFYCNGWNGLPGGATHMFEVPTSEAKAVLLCPGRCQSPAVPVRSDVRAALKAKARGEA